MPTHSNSALLLIDLQRKFLLQQDVYANPNLPNLPKLCARFADAARPYAQILHIAMIPSETKLTCDKLTGKDPKISEILSDSYEFYNINPAADDVIFLKNDMSAVRGNPSFVPYLKSQGVKCVYITGVYTDSCVAATSRDLYKEGFDIVLVPNLCLERSLINPISIKGKRSLYYFSAYPQDPTTKISALSDKSALRALKLNV